MDLQLSLLGIKRYIKDNAEAKKGNVLPEMQVGDEVQLAKLNPEQHFTQPPARYSEATLIKTLEEIGVGRPSTYAPTIEIKKRYYVKLVSNVLNQRNLDMLFIKLSNNTSQILWILISLLQWKIISTLLKKERRVGTSYR